MAIVAAIVLLAAVYLCALLITGAKVGAQDQSNVQPVRGLETCSTVPAKTFNRLLKQRVKYGGKAPKKWASRPVCVRPDFRRVQGQVNRLKRQYKRRLEADVRFAIAKAFDPLGRTGEALRVAYCESTHNRFATNGQYRGLFQLGAHHYFRLRGLPYSHAYANARAAASIVREDGGFRQWECQP